MSFRCLRIGAPGPCILYCLGFKLCLGNWGVEVRDSKGLMHGNCVIFQGLGKRSGCVIRYDKGTYGKLLNKKP